MKEVRRIKIPWEEKKTWGNPPRSLCWDGDELVDWVSGGTRYDLDGGITPSRVNYSYRFDHAIVSPSGEYVAILERLGTKGLLLKDGRIIREINRSYYCAEAYEYPLAFLTLSDGRTGVAHCPDEYCKLEIEEVETGQCLTKRSCESQDFFYSRLSVSSNSRYLASSGWVWHPFEDVCVYDVEQVLKQPERLDGGLLRLTRSGVPVNMAVLSDSSSLVLTTSNDFYDPDDVDADEAGLLPPDNIAVYDLAVRQIVSQAPLEEAAGAIIPLNSDFVLGCYQHPKVIEIATGKVVAKWDELPSGEQMSCIIHHSEALPPLAVDTIHHRFAIASGEDITVIQLG